MIGINKDYDVRIIFYYIGYVIIGTAGLMILPILTSLFYKEWNPLIDFIISFCISFDLGIILVLWGKSSVKRVRIQWKHGLVIASLSWIILMILCAIPYEIKWKFKLFFRCLF